MYIEDTLYFQHKNTAGDFKFVSISYRAHHLGIHLVV